MAIAFRAVGALAGADSGNVASIGLPAGHTTDDILLLVANQFDNVASTVSGYTLVASATNGSTCSVRIFAKRDNGAESAPTLTHTAGGVVSCWIAAYSGVPNTLTVGTGAGSIIRDVQNNTGTGGTQTTPALSGLLSGDMRLTLIGQTGSDTSGGATANYSPSVGFTERIDNGRISATSGHAVGTIDDFLSALSAGTSQTGNATGFAGTVSWIGFQLALASSAGAPDPGYVQSRPLMPLLHRFSQLARPYLPVPVPVVDVAPSGVVYQPTGSLVAGTVASGDGQAEYSETGSLLADTLASGADVAEHAETGSLTTRALASGDGIHEAVESGSLTAGTSLSGADVFNPNETGTAPVGTLLSGVSQYIPAGPVTYQKTGSITAGTLVSGPDSFQPVEAGSLTSRALVSGADVFTASETGTTPVGALLSGVSVKISSNIYVKTGSLVAGSLLAGVDASTLNRAGSVTARALVSGVSAKSGLTDPGFPGPFDADTEAGRSGELVSDANLVTATGGRSGARNSGGGFTSAQKGRIGSDQ